MWSPPLESLLLLAESHKLHRRFGFYDLQRRQTISTSHLFLYSSFNEAGSPPLAAPLAAPGQDYTTGSRLIRNQSNPIQSNRNQANPTKARKPQKPMNGMRRWEDDQ